MWTCALRLILAGDLAIFTFTFINAHIRVIFIKHSVLKFKLNVRWRVAVNIIFCYELKPE